MLVTSARFSVFCFKKNQFNQPSSKISLSLRNNKQRMELKKKYRFSFFSTKFFSYCFVLNCPIFGLFCESSMKPFSTEKMECELGCLGISAGTLRVIELRY